MRILYFGSPDFSARLLERLLEHPGFQVVAVITNPDRPKGRSGRPIPTPVGQLALDNGLPVYRFESLRGQEAEEAVRSVGADLAVVFAYGLIIPASIFSAPRLGSVNLHGSLLPDLRGASPVQTAVLKGYRRTGWTLQKLAAKMDAGDILSTCELEIDPEETAGELMDRMLTPGIDLVLHSLPRLEGLLAQARPQVEGDATYCAKLRPADAWIEWSADADTIHNQIRGMNPSPVARTRLTDRSEPFLIFRGRVVLPEDAIPASLAGTPPSSDPSLPGTIFVAGAGKKKRLLVQTGSKFLEIIELQPSGRRRMPAADLLNGGTIADGMRFAPAPAVENPYD